MERDFIGYGKTPPKVEWPNKARVAISLVVNYEEGSEFSFAFGVNLIGWALLVIQAYQIARTTNCRY